MNASHEWLRAFVPHTRSADEVRALLSAHVATVDAMTPMRADLANIVIARVVSAERHPDSDHLWVTKVDDGSGEPLDVVCGAANVSAGTLYPFARTGTVLPGGLTIERRKIRGAVSNGMLCSARELGLGEDHSGILALTVDAAPGTRFLDAMPIGDWSFDIDVLPNRPDLLSHVGLARELSALTGIGMRLPPELDGMPHAPHPVTAEREGRTGGATIRIDDLAGCPRYFAVVILGIRVGPSPAWLQERLGSVGVRSISNVVDVTNYFLHAFGQPMHAFDLAKLGQSQIVVRRANRREKLTTLDGVDRELDAEMLVIADASRAMAVAGVLGGRDSEVSESTTDVLLEVANFDPRSVRRTRRALGISTDASHRFERGTDPAEPVRSGSLAAALIASLGGGRVDGEPVLVGVAAPPRPSVTVHPDRLSRLLGAPVEAGDVAARLGAIGFSVEPAVGGSLAVTPPSWRHDVGRDVDVLEELARLRGYDTLPDALAPFRPSVVPDHPLYTRTQRVSGVLVGAGFSEVRPLPFVAGDDATHIRVTNPLADDEPHLRTAVLDSLARRAEYNLARREGNLRLFEVGSAFARSGDTGREECRVACLMMGARRPVHFTEPPPPAFDEWDAKAIAGVLALATFPGAAVELRDGAHGALWTIVVDGIGTGIVRRVALDAPPWASPAFGVELALGELSVAPVAPPGSNAHAAPGATRMRPPVRYTALPTMPAAEFDLALLVPDGVRAAQVDQVLRRAAGELLEGLLLFDQFQGKGVPDGYRSLAWRLTFRHPERTLNDKEIAGRRQKILATLEKELRVVPRSS